MASTKKGEATVLPRFGRVKNNLKMGIVGLPNVGKSSLFNLLGESAHAAAENFPFCTIVMKILYEHSFETLKVLNLFFIYTVMSSGPE